MPPTLDPMADLTLEQRNAALTAWLNDLTTVYEKCAAERDALRASCRELVAAMVAYEMDVEEDAPPAHRAMMERAHRLLEARDA